MKRAIAIFVLVLALPGAALAAGLELKSTPDRIEIGALYNGASLTVEGKVPQGCQVALRFSGAPENVIMKQKGKALGLLWMNMDTLHFSNVPKVCLVESSVELKDMGASAAALNLESLAERIAIEPATAARQVLLPELLKLKQSEGLYREKSGAIRLGPELDGMQSFSLKLAIPSRLSPGDYSLEAFAVKDGQIVSQASLPLEVKMVGIPALLADLAFNHAAWYGVLASIIAILAGLGIGLVFQSKGAH